MLLFGIGCADILTEPHEKHKEETAKWGIMMSFYSKIQFFISQRYLLLKQKARDNYSNKVFFKTNISYKDVLHNVR